MSVVHRLNDVIRRCDMRLAAGDESHLADVVRELAEAAHDLARLTSPIDEQRTHLEAHREIENRLRALEGQAPGEPVQLEIGHEYELVLRVKATVVVGNSRGESYELRIEQRDFVEPRTLCVDADEIQSAR